MSSNLAHPGPRSDHDPSQGQAADQDRVHDPVRDWSQECRRASGRADGDGSGEDQGVAHDPDTPLLLACRALARAIDLFEEAACEVLAIGRSDLRALNLLEHGPLSPAVIADQLRLSRSSVTSLLDRLERAGYVTRSADLADRRGVQVALKPETFRAFARVYLPLGMRVHDSVEHLSHDDRSALLKGLGVLTDAFHEASESASNRSPARESRS